MKKKKNWSIMLMLVLMLGASTVISSCCDEENFYSAMPPEGLEAVDLGLPSGTKWASCNIGATKPEEFGDYFAWGETVGYKNGKRDFSWKSCTLSSNSDWTGITKYTIADNQTEGAWYNGDTFVGDNKTILDSEDDVASVRWGDEWRIPTKEEMDELRKECEWSWENVNGTWGYRVTSKVKTDKDGNKTNIFLPVAGYISGSSLTGVGNHGDYWTSSLRESNSRGAYCLRFSSDDIDFYSYDRYFGQSVRAVCK